MLRPIVIPEATPARKAQGYNIPETKETLLSWDFVSEHMSQSRHYWICTIFPDGRPHVVPVWGIWFEHRLFFEGSMQTAWDKNISHNPHIAVHTPDAEKVVIIEGTAHIIQDDEIDHETWNILDRTFQQKYQIDKGSPYISVHPKRVLAWDGEGLTTMTRWLFNE
ncbi:pyridoxamine 5'-phosphate oxidase family protein [Roseiflexus castenholzii]|uniref:pyridoxamine 5'-phosphate oxidase family protein n=1 Tax=Roseiflexus castenholzii TaxID=120962 RepID=UPI003C79A399